MTADRDAADLHAEVLADPEAVVEAVADHLVAGLGRALADRGAAVLALSGGRTPVPLYRHLATRDLPWADVHVVQVDERIAPDGHPDRNWPAIAEGLVDPTGATGHPMPAGPPPDPGRPAGYARELALLGGIDACHLGLGDDGHTASLVPGDPVLAVDDVDVALAGPYQGRHRMTLTARAINAAGVIVWHVVGAGKRAAVARLLDGGAGDPSGLVRRAPAVHLVVDRAAARQGGG